MEPIPRQVGCDLAASKTIGPGQVGPITQRIIEAYWNQHREAALHSSVFNPDN